MKTMHSNFGLLAVITGLILLMVSENSWAEDSQRYWVYFRDKQVLATQMNRALDDAAQKLTPAARERRLREMLALVDEYDLPVSANYVAQVNTAGAKLRHASRWLNALSVEATSSQVESIKSLPCVLKVERFRLRAIREPLPARGALDDLNYGNSYVQDSLCHIPELHNRGLSGHGILMCILDTGAWLVHNAFDSLHVIATYDFVNHDTIVANESGQDTWDQHYHGTATLSTMSGYKDSLLIGPAYGANILVAKTEWVAGEVHSEEDNYVAGLEWADSLGARITTSSLGYIGDAPDFWYTFAELDGHTAVTTRGLEMAASRGILCVTAAGNENGSSWNHLVTPADADSILAVGAVTSGGIIADFSSRGPTGDGRIKPDVCAQGVATFCANADAINAYAEWSGTSLATPIVAGIAALLMEDHPEWTAQQVRKAIKSTASMAADSNNNYGWGIVDAVAAADYVFDSAREPSVLPRNPAVLLAYPNPFNAMATLNLTLATESHGRLALFDLLGREVYAWPGERWAAGVTRVSLSAENLATGIYVARFRANTGNAAAKIVILK
jgi:subtilisin family serine protease